MLEATFGNFLTLGLLGIFVYMAWRKLKPKLLNSITTLFIKKLESRLPEILESVGLSVAEQIKDMISEQFLNPNVKRFFSHIGTEGGEVKTDKALQKRVANTLLEQYPAAGIILDKLNITPVEALKLMNDPLIGPRINQALAQLTGGLQGKTNKDGAAKGVLGFDI